MRDWALSLQKQPTEGLPQDVPPHSDAPKQVGDAQEPQVAR